MNPVLTLEVARLAHEERLREAAAHRWARSRPRRAAPWRLALGRAVERLGARLAGREAPARATARGVTRHAH